MDLPGFFNEKRINYALVFLIIVISLILLGNSINRFFDHDELEVIHVAWKILQGEEIYKDFFEHHHPLFYYSLTPLIAVFGESTSTIIILRLFVYVIYILTISATYRLSFLILKDKRAALLSVLMLGATTTYFNKAVDVRIDPAQVLFGVLSLQYLFRYLDNPDKVRHILASGVMLGISFVIYQKAAFLLIGVTTVLLLHTYLNKLSVKNLLCFYAGFTAAISPYFFYLLFSGGLESYFFFNWTLNRHFISWYNPMALFKNTFIQNTVLWVFYVLGLFYLKKENEKYLYLISVILILSVFLVGATFRQSLMMSLPLVSVISAYSVCRTVKDQKHIFIAFVFLSVLYPCVVSFSQIHQRSNADQLKKIDYVLDITDNNDYVYDGDIRFNVFRKDIDFFWYSVTSGRGGLETYKKLRDYDYDIYRLIEEKRPRVISSFSIENLDHEVISRNYRRSPVYDDLFILRD